MVAYLRQDRIVATHASIVPRCVLDAEFYKINPNAVLVGFSLYYTNCGTYFHLAQMIMQEFNASSIVFGGRLAKTASYDSLHDWAAK